MINTEEEIKVTSVMCGIVPEVLCVDLSAVLVPPFDEFVLTPFEFTVTLVFERLLLPIEFHPFVEIEVASGVVELP